MISTLPSKLDPTTQQPIRVLLVDDQEFILESVRRMLADQPDIAFFTCQDPAKAVLRAEEVHPTVILQDLVMPEIDGLVLVRFFRANPATKEVPMIVLSAEEEAGVKAQAFALGANDYIVKLPDKQELLARIRYHSNAYIRLLERNEAYRQLEESQLVLQHELNNAAEYVRSSVPPPLDDDYVTTAWKFIPSALLGGDSFGYHWLDAEHFAMHLLDVCGHGVGAALLSISATNLLRSQSLPNTDFHDPVAVLQALNETFGMEQHNGMYFTMWYGVYQPKTRRLKFSSGGHPPAILITGPSSRDTQVVKLKTPGMVIGGMPTSRFISDEVEVGPYGKMFVFSDGVYELQDDTGPRLEMAHLIETMQTAQTQPGKDLDDILAFSSAINQNQPFPDDFSVVSVQFK